MKTAYILIGPPAIGKSTWTKNNAPDAIVVSRDDIHMKNCKEHGFQYDESFLAPPTDVEIGSVVPGFEKFGKVIPSSEFVSG